MARMGEEIPRCQQTHVPLTCMTLSLVEMPKVSKDSSPHSYTPHHKKVYQALCYMLIFALFGKEYDVRMDQDASHGRSDITAHPFSPQRLLALVFEIKSVARHLKWNGKRSLKTAKHREGFGTCPRPRMHF